MYFPDKMRSTQDDDNYRSDTSGKYSNMNETKFKIKRSFSLIRYVVLVNNS